jgi:hypothetical protein
VRIAKPGRADRRDVPGVGAATSAKHGHRWQDVPQCSVPDPEVGRIADVQLGGVDRRTQSSNTR